MKRAIKIFGVAVLFLGLSASLLFAQEKISLRIDFPTPEISEVGDYHRIRMEGLTNAGLSGEPILPIKTVRLLIPCGKEAGEIKVTGEEKVILPGSYVIEPAQRPVPIGYQGSLTLPKPEIYNSSSPFPESLSSNQMMQKMRGYRIQFVNIHPVEYIPSTGQLSYYKSMKVEVNLEVPPAPLAPDPMYRGSLKDSEKVKDIIDNPDALDTFPQESPLPPLQTYEYLIITNNDLNIYSGANNLGTLATHKEGKGLTTHRITTETIYADPSYPGTRPDGGTDNQTSIRECIIDYYTNHGTIYVLLVGDGDAGGPAYEEGEHEAAPIIPRRGFYDIVATQPPTEDFKIPADMYYACLDGSFDEDGDGIYGEDPAHNAHGIDEADLYAEVYVGRAPVDSLGELSDFVKKTIAYENSTAAYLRTVYMVGEDLGVLFALEGGDYKDEIKTWSESNSYKTTGFTASDYYTVSTLYDKDSIWAKTDLSPLINTGLHIINHLGHAANYTVMKMYQEQTGDPLYNDVDSLTNTDYFFGYSQGCYAGAFDNYYYGTSDYVNYDCILEHFVTSAHGAFAFIGNSRYGWGSGTDTDGASQSFDRHFWDEVLREGKFHLGEANQDSKEENAGVINSIDAVRWCYFTINLLGDPETSLYLPTTAPIIESISPTSREGSSVSLTITGTRFPAGATTQLTKTDKTPIDGTELVISDTTEITCNFALSGATAGYWNVVATDTAGTGYKGTLPDSFTILPTAPSGLSASAVSASQIDLSWTDNSTGETGFKIERRTGTGGTYSQIATPGAGVTTYSNTGLSAGTTYYYQVRAYVTGGNSSYSDEAQATTHASSEAAVGGGGSTGCFIATSAYNYTDDHRFITDGHRSQITTLQEFRDERLLTNPSGRAFVSCYERISPPIARYIEDKEPLKAVVRFYLKPIVWGARKILK